jgi:hypothetical protein
MITINMPGFSADASLYSTSRNYVTAVTERGGATAVRERGGGIRLAQFDDVTLRPPNVCGQCISACRQFCPRRFPICFTTCLQVNCSEVCGG